ncbi:cadmium resistance transporter [Lentilactobacillus sp. SPB1-3]|uniref:Cadmium resistance transporter n=1 Tax=Lentilactobacillus terminaliae TaxID=3003483 RepID=A0ACD5DFS9_9LACO|nr:cadmium resistance transporter [Lentilactobacillus sp. SPB1-3]MCZ0976325.1 cadmium resistance transporter [Lentilactobacillus sp. SPB1-3]
MLEALGTALLSYIGTTSDYFVVLLLVFGMYRGRLARPVFAGAYVGNLILIAVSLIIADVLKLIPEEWILGLLGFIPIFMGIKGLFSHQDEGEDAAKKLSKTNSKKVFSSVVLITVAGCGADNMAMYIPFFANTSATYVPAILVLFLVVLSIIIFSAYYLTLLPPVHVFFEKFGEMSRSIIYIALGCYVLYDAGTISHFISMI